MSKQVIERKKKQWNSLIQQPRSNEADQSQILRTEIHLWSFSHYHCACIWVCLSMCLFLCVFPLLSHQHWKGNIKQKYSVAWKFFVSHMKVIPSISLWKSLYPPMFLSFLFFLFSFSFFLDKLSNYLYLSVLSCKIVKKSKFNTGTFSLSSKNLWLLQL